MVKDAVSSDAGCEVPPAATQDHFAGMLKNASASLIGNLLSIPLQFLGFVIVARALGPTVFGQYSFAQELTLFVFYIADCGLSIIATREMVRDKARAGAIHGSLLRLKIVLSTLCYAAILAAGLAMSDSRSTFLAVAILGVSNLMFSYLLLANGVFRASGRMVWESVTGMLQPIGFCVFTALVAYSGLVPNGLLPMALARLGSFVPVVLLALFITWRLVPPRRPDRPGMGKGYLGEGLPIVMVMFTFDALLRISVFFLQIFASNEELGMFTVSARIVYSLWTIPYIFSGAWLPGMTRCVAQRQEEAFSQHGMRLTRLLCFASAPIAVVLYMAATPIILLLFGPNYLPGVPVMRVLALAVPFLFLFYGMKTILEAKNQQRRLYFVVLVGLTVALGANTLFVAPMGAVGAAWAYLCGISASVGLGYALVAREIAWGRLVVSVARILCGGVAAALTLWLLLPVSLFLGLGASCGVYLMVLFLIRELNPREMFNRA